jgi:hypothetical protein
VPPVTILLVGLVSSNVIESLPLAYTVVEEHPPLFVRLFLENSFGTCCVMTGRCCGSDVMDNNCRGDRDHLGFLSLNKRKKWRGAHSEVFWYVLSNDYTSILSSGVDNKPFEMQEDRFGPGNYH